MRSGSAGEPVLTAHIPAAPLGCTPGGALENRGAWIPPWGAGAKCQGESWALSCLKLRGGCTGQPGLRTIVRGGTGCLEAHPVWADADRSPFPPGWASQGPGEGSRCRRGSSPRLPSGGLSNKPHISAWMLSGGSQGDLLDALLVPEVGTLLTSSL